MHLFIKYHRNLTISLWVHFLSATPPTNRNTTNRNTTNRNTTNRNTTNRNTTNRNTTNRNTTNRNTTNRNTTNRNVYFIIYRSGRMNSLPFWLQC